VAQELKFTLLKTNAQAQVDNRKQGAHHKQLKVKQFERS
jgi:hypothetical protein